MTPDTNPIRTAIYLSLLMVLISSVSVATTRYASDYTSTAAIVTLQYLVCCVLCIPRTVRHGLAPLATQRLPLHLFRGVVGVLGFYLFYASVQHIALVDAMLLRQSAPLTLPLVMWAWNRERVPWRSLIPLVIGFMGIAVILRPSPEGLSWWHAAGVASAFTLSISMVATGELARTEPASRILFYYFFLSLVCVAPFSLGDFSGLPWQVWLAMLFIGVSMYFALGLYTRAYALAPAWAIAPVNYLAVVLTGVWGWLIWGQVPDTWTLLGSALVIGGGLFTIALGRRIDRSSG
ncbi:DMT family transporter [Halieaceae bacterium IMCC14734]|uniref:DMT family transporter n=1 Tax=Candidatus Litorirhabdus singularis TaxID=2518993 RepID=A0ABT3TKW9_9GAMM|nr:DMT family transporter [Candidatus Litorirhabdus singularis]MCX2982958.1 DMT family transporter [Candidatus Litorirhabdus singularis]